MMIEELAFVALEGTSVTYSHAVLVETSSSWNVELEDVPADSCPFHENECDITFDTWEGRHYEGTVSASYSRTEPTYLILTGKGALSCVLAGKPEDVDGVPQS
jgi:hypothetical protein